MNERARMKEKGKRKTNLITKSKERKEKRNNAKIRKKW